MAYRFGPFRYDPVSRCLFRGDREIALTPKARELLVFFLENPHRLLTRQDLSDRVWAETAVTDEAMRFQLFELRKALGAEADHFIKTVPKEGYRWETDVRSEGDRDSADGTDLIFRLVGLKREIDLAPGANILGRERGVAVWIDDHAVSRHHARIVVGNGKATVEDLGSKNGTDVNGRRIAKATPLADGDEIRIGPATMRLQVLVSGGSTETEEKSR